MPLSARYLLSTLILDKRFSGSVNASKFMISVAVVLGYHNQLNFAFLSFVILGALHFKVSESPANTTWL